MNAPVLKRRSVEITPYRPDDLDELHTLIVQTIRASYPAHYPPRAVEFFVNHHPPVKIAADGASGFVIVARIDGRMVGTATLALDTVARVFVLPEIQGQGFGKILMDRIESQARSSGLTRLVLDASLPALRFYEARGYRKISDESIDVGENQQLRYYRMEMEL